MTDKESTNTMTIRVSQSLHLQIKIAANKDGRTVNGWVNKVLKEYLEIEKKRG